MSRSDSSPQRCVPNDSVGRTLRIMQTIKNAAIRATRTFLQAFLAVVTGAPLLNANVSTLKAAGFAGIGAVLSLVQNALEQASNAPVPRA